MGGGGPLAPGARFHRHPCSGAPGGKASPHHTRRRRHDPRRTLTLLAGRERRPLRESGSRGSLRGLPPRFQFKLPATATGFRFARFRDGPNAPSKPIGRRKQKWANRLPRTRTAGSDWFFRTDLKIKLSPPGAGAGVTVFFCCRGRARPRAFSEAGRRFEPLFPLKPGNRRTRGKAWSVAYNRRNYAVWPTLQVSAY